LINIFLQFVARNVTFNFIDSILLTIILCVYGGLYFAFNFNDINILFRLTGF